MDERRDTVDRYVVACRELGDAHERLADASRAATTAQLRLTPLLLLLRDEQD